MNTPQSEIKTSGPSKSAVAVLAIEASAITRSVPLLRLPGLEIRMEILLLLISFIGLLSAAFRGMSSMVLMIAGVLAALFLHELGHLLAAKFLGYRVPVLVLSPFGSLLRLTDLRRPRDGICISLAGPLTSIAVAGVTWIYLAHTGHAPTLLPHVATLDNLATLFFLLNLILGLVNLIPALPFDGANALRSVLTPRIGPLSAVEILVLLSRFQVLVFAVFGLIRSDITGAAIAIIILFSTNREASHSQYRHALRLLMARDALLTELPSLSPGDTLNHAWSVARGLIHSDLPVISGTELVGVLLQEDRDRHIAQGEGDAYIAGVMLRDLPTLNPTDTLEFAVRRSWNGRRCTPLLVFDGTQFLGLVTPDSIQRVVNQSALNPSTSADTSET